MSRKVPLTPKTDCPCGEIHDRCHGRRSDGKPCRCWPPDGSDKCGQRHGASTKRAKAAQQRRVKEAELAHSLARFWQAADGVSPIDAYQQALAVVAGNVAALPTVLAEAEQAREALKAAGNVPPSTVVDELEFAQKVASEAAKVADLGVRSGIAERVVALSEGQIGEAVDAVLRGLAAIGGDDDTARVFLEAAFPG